CLSDCASLLVLCRCRAPRRCPLLPYTTLFRSAMDRLGDDEAQTAERLDAGRDADEGRRAGKRVLLAGREHGRHDHGPGIAAGVRSEEHTSELQSRVDLVCRLLLEKKKTTSPT